MDSNSNNKNNMVEICDICGHVGYVEVLVTCSLCKLARQHIYCMRVYLKDIPKCWVCESCACPLGETNFSDMVYEDIVPLACEPNIIILDGFEETHTKTTNVDVASVLGQQPPPATTESQGNEDDFVYPNTTSDMTRSERRVRGASQGIRLNKTIVTMGRLKVTWTPTQGKPVGEMASLFNGEIGVLVRKFIPLKYEKQKDIPIELYDNLTQQLLNQFDVDILQPHIKRYINYEIGNRFKDYRWTLYKHYQKYADPAEARRNPYKYVTPNDWNILCDRWESYSWKEKSAKNKVSRSKIRFNHCGGSKSFLSYRAGKGKEDATYISPIEVFYETHCSASKGWVDQAAKEAYEKMLILRQEKGSSTPKTDEEIMVMVLGKRSSYMEGLGYKSKPPRSSKEALSYSQEYVESLETRLARTEELLDDQRRGYERKFSQINDILKKFSRGRDDND